MNAKKKYEKLLILKATTKINKSNREVTYMSQTIFRREK